MGTPIETFSLNQNPETIIRYEVTCLFCGLPTPVPVPGPLTFACHVPRHISIVRCELCGKDERRCFGAHNCRQARPNNVSWPRSARRS